MAAEADDDEGAKRALGGNWRLGATALGVALALLHVAAALNPFLDELERNTLHFAGFALMAALWLPAAQSWRRGPGQWADLALGLAVAAAAIHVGLAETAVYERGVRLSTLDWIAGFVVLFGALEYSRRAVGIAIPLMIAAALLYVVWWGRFVPGVFRFPGLGPETVMFRTLYGDDGMFGSIARISSTTVFLFIIFGAFLVRSGAGDFVIALARGAAGRLIGGPGLVAVIASALTGTISGSAVANTASTGVITIPLMKRAGYSPVFAGGVEAAASTGGQLMPPIMGAGAFVMASYTQIPYETIVAVSLLPALLYFASVAFFVRIEARKLGLGAFDEGGASIRDAMRRGGASFVIPLTLVIGLLTVGFTDTYAAAIGIGAVIASSWLTTNPMGPRAIWEALAMGAKNMTATAVLLVAVGAFVNVIVTSGVGQTFSLMIQDWSAGNLLIAMAMIALASVVLGLGLPTTAAYIVLATLSAPALTGMIADSQIVDLLVSGALPPTAQPILMLASPEAALAAAEAMPRAEAAALVNALPIEVRGPLRDLALTPAALTTALLAGHLIIFWLSQDSNVTPPVALASFTAAAIAKASPNATGFASWKLAKGLYIVPCLFAYSPIISGDPVEALRVFAFAVVGIYGICAAMEGWMECRLPLPLRVAAGVFGVASIWPGPIWIDLAGAAGVVALAVWSWRRAARA